MNGMTTMAKLFITSLGIIFILIGVILSLALDLPTVLTVGIGIVGLFLIFLPYTRDRYNKEV